MPNGSIIKIGDEFTRLTVLAPAGQDRDGKTLWLCACKCFNLTWARTAQLNSKMKQDFAIFYRILGKRPSPSHSVDRENNDGNYSCGECPECIEKGWPFNVRWATQKEQMANTSRTILITHNNETHCLAEWARMIGISGTGLRDRMRRMPLARALTMPVQKHNRMLTHNDETRNFRTWSKLLHVPESTINDRLRDGRSIEEALSTARLPYRRIRIKSNPD